MDSSAAGPGNENRCPDCGGRLHSALGTICPHCLLSATLSSADLDEPIEPDEELPRRFGRFELRQLLGQGGMGRVYLAWDERLDRTVAIKFPRFGSESDDNHRAIERFHREARAMASVSHPNLCPIFDVAELDGVHYLSMAYFENGSLAELEKPLPAKQAVSMTRKLAEAMHVAHEAGIIHRDLKPSNVVLDQNGEPVITDFGLAARRRETDPALTHTDRVMGSPLYMAPEQAKADHEQVGPATDIYALGGILYELLTGQRPYAGDPVSVAARIASGEKPLPPSSVAAVDSSLDAVCLQSLSLEPQDRQPSMQDLAEQLAACESASGSTGVEGSRNFRFAGMAIIVILTIIWLGRPDENPGFASSSPSPSDAATADSSPAPSPEWLPVNPVTHLPNLKPNRRSLARFVGKDQRFLPAVSADAALADLDEDGDLDIALALRSATHSWILLNDGHGVFAASDQAMEPGNWSAIAVGDLNGDNHPDIFLGSDTHNSAIWLNNGNGEFHKERQRGPIGRLTISVALADVDQDGDLDVWSSRAGREPDLLLVNDGEGHFSELEVTPAEQGSTNVAFADINSDKRPDAVSIASSGFVWLNEGGNRFRPTPLPLAETIGFRLSTADLDRDHDVDIVLTSHTGPPRVLLNEGNTRFSEHATLPTLAAEDVFTSPWKAAVDLGDLDGDGSLDCFLVVEGHGFEAWLNDGKGNFKRRWRGAGQPLPGNVRLGDLDGDGDLDAFVAQGRRGNPKSNYIWFNRNAD